MADLRTKYLGLDLKNPIIVGASNLVSDPDNLVAMEKAGAAAIVYKSLFEEQIQYESFEMDQANEIYSDWDAEHASIFPQTGHAGPAEHLIRLKKARELLTIPLIGSLNCVRDETWVEYAVKMADAGIDALELNFYANEIDFDREGRHVVKRQLSILKDVSKAVKIPLAVKLSPYYTNGLSVIKKMDEAGADGFVLFNRLFQPDIDIEKEEHNFPYNFSTSTDSRLSLRFAGLLYKNINASVCSNTGIFTGEDVVKMLLAGADSVQVVSTIYKKGIKHLTTMVKDIEKWMKAKKYKKITDFRGKLSKVNMPDPFTYKRAQYVDILMKSELFLEYHPKGDETEV